MVTISMNVIIAAWGVLAGLLIAFGGWCLHIRDRVARLETDSANFSKGMETIIRNQEENRNAQAITNSKVLEGLTRVEEGLSYLKHSAGVTVNTGNTG